MKRKIIYLLLIVSCMSLFSSAKPTHKICEYIKCKKQAIKKTENTSVAIPLLNPFIFNI